MKLKIIYDFFRLWIKWGDRKEAWQDSKLINDIKFKEDMKNFDVEIKLNKMNGEEINIFLESIGGLENGYYPDRERITKSTFFDIEEGWYPLVKELIEDLIELGWDKQICQVKEKFGGLRFYINGGSDEIFKRIVKAENDSYNTYLGRYIGSGSGLDLRTGSNFIVFSDGQSNVRQYYDGTNNEWIWNVSNITVLELNTASLSSNVPVIATEFTGSLYGTASIVDGGLY